MDNMQSQNYSHIQYDSPNESTDIIVHSNNHYHHFALSVVRNKIQVLEGESGVDEDTVAIFRFKPKKQK